MNLPHSIAGPRLPTEVLRGAHWAAPWNCGVLFYSYHQRLKASCAPTNTDTTQGAQPLTVLESADLAPMFQAEAMNLSFPPRGET